MVPDFVMGHRLELDRFQLQALRAMGITQRAHVRLEFTEILWCDEDSE